MFSAIRRRMHLSPATVIASLALVLAMSGGAYAASKYVITSTKQIKPSVLKQLQGKAGANGAQGLTGAQGAQGPAGPAGAKGETGPQGTEGKEGKQGTPGANGTTGFTETLPPEKTETGVWTGNPVADTSTEELLAPISFDIPLTVELPAARVHVAPSSECPGTAEEPKANPGNLCVYVGNNLAEFGEVKDINKPTGDLEAGAGKNGAWLDIAPKSGKPLAVIYGTWAVTAPE